jgi:LDH2 family malate/lactate/ureidoglycolate dehydrogenase
MKEALYLVKPEEFGNLVLLGANIFEKCGMFADDAKILVDSLLDADMRGVKSHGLLRIPSYVEQLNKGEFNGKPKIQVTKETSFSLVLDGDNGAGSVVSSKAVDMCRKKALETGLAIVVVKKSNHFGTAGYWALKLAGDDMIGFSSTNSVPIVSPPGGISRGIGSNPFSFSIPAGGGEAICLDISVGVMAQGKIFEYARLNKPLPDNAWLGPDGEITTDPNKFPITEYVMMPFGMHKGFGLGIVIEMISSALADTEFHREYSGLDNGKIGLCHTFMAVCIENFVDLRSYKKHVNDYIEYVHSLPVKEHAPNILYPGEIEAGLFAKHNKEGLEIAVQVLDEAIDIAKKMGLDTSYLQLQKVE